MRARPLTTSGDDDQLGPKATHEPNLAAEALCVSTSDAPWDARGR